MGCLADLGGTPWRRDYPAAIVGLCRSVYEPRYAVWGVMRYETFRSAKFGGRRLSIPREQEELLLTFGSQQRECL
jgi:hypothetical protein